MIYIFRQYDSDKQIIIYAESYLEAKETLFEFNQWADKIYNILEYKMYNIDIDKFYDVLNIDENGYGYPRIISKNEFNILRENKVILDEDFKDIHNTRVLMTSDSTEGFPLLSTEEFVNLLKINANNISYNKNNIYQMLNIVGDIWFEEFFENRIKYIAYGKSRFQCEKIIELVKNKYNDKSFTTYGKKELLIENSYCNELTPRSIERYNNMVEFMKANNIKKFPFTTYIFI